MQTQSKKTLLKMLVGIGLFSGTVLNLNLSSDNNSDSGLTVEAMDAFADSGTCCPESGSSCVIGAILTTNAYYKASGSCKE